MNEQKNDYAPAQALDIEKAVLGTILQFTTGLDDCLELIKSPEIFYSPKHRIIFDTIKKLSDASDPVDIITVSERLERRKDLQKIGGAAYLIDLVQVVASSAHIEYHSKILLQKYMLRSLSDFGRNIIERTYQSDIDVFTLMDAAGMELDLIGSVVSRGAKMMPWDTAVLEVPKKVEFLSNNQGGLTGVDTGLKSFNKFFGGWQNSDLVIIGADSGMGKTALAMCHLLAPAKNGQAVGMVSMEMSTIQLAIRAVSVEGSINMVRLTRKGFEKLSYFEKLNQVVDKLKDLPIYIDDRPSLTIPEMKRRARQMKRKYDIKLFVADFIQMFSGDEDDVKLTGQAARELKNLAKELNIPVIALSQLNREVKKAQYNIPSKHHLKNSSGIEEAADVIGLLYRPEYYNFTVDKYPDLWHKTLDLQGDENAVLFVEKNRNGAMGRIPIQYIPEKTKYVNAGEYQQAAQEPTPF